MDRNNVTQETIADSLSRFHGGATVRVTRGRREIIGDIDVIEAWVTHADGSTGWEHTVDFGRTWIPRKAPICRH